MKDKLITQMKYKKGAKWIDPLAFKECVDPPFAPLEASLDEAGVIERNGIRLEYQVYRVVYQKAAS